VSLFVAGLTLLVGLALLYRVVRDLSGHRVAAWTIIGVSLGTGLIKGLLQGSDPIPGAMAFALTSVALALWGPAGPGSRSLGAAVGNLAALVALAVPYLRGGVSLPQPWRLEARLFGSPGGLLFGAPFLWTGVVGLVLLGRRQRRAAAGPVAVVLLVIAASIATSRPEAPFQAALPALALGTGAFLSWLLPVVGRHPGLPIVAAGVVLTVWNALFMEQYRTDRIPRDLPVSFSQVAETNAAILSRAVGSPLSWPANWLFAWRHHVTPAKFDVLAGRSLLSSDTPRKFRLDDLQVDPSLLAEGWGARISWNGVTCRRLVGSARLLLPLDQARPWPFTIEASGSGGLSVEINSHPLPRVSLEPAFSERDFRAAARFWRNGINEVRLTYTGPGEARIAAFAFGAEERP